MKITRSEFLCAVLGAAFVADLPGSGHAQGGQKPQLPAKAQGGFGVQSGDGERASRVASAIEEYDRQGIHRTASDVDNRSGQWLLDRAWAAGADARLEPSPINRVDVHAAYVEAEGRRAEGLPLFDSTFTDAAGIVGRVAPPEYGHPVALVVLDGAGISSEGRAIDALRRSNTHRAVVAVTNGAHPGLSPSNALAFANPYGVPVLQVDTDDHLWLRDLTARGVEIRLVSHATRTPAEASNVIATVAGREPRLAPIVVMTPRSGWWRCASERGGGIACWLEALRGAAAARPSRTVLAVASSGHELGHFGLDAFLDTRRDLVKGAAAWIHLGANIGAARGVPRLQASDDRIEAQTLEALTRIGAEVKQRVARGTRPGGEARNIHDGGGRYVSLLGSGPFFHNVADRWPGAVDVAAVSRFSQAIADVAVLLANATSLPSLAALPFPRSGPRRASP